MARQPSRPKRWQQAVTNASNAVQQIMSELDNLEQALADLKEVQDEYVEWKDNLPDNLQGGTLAEKLDVICDLSIEDAASDIRTALEELEGTISEAEGADLPRGFGRD